MNEGFSSAGYAGETALNHGLFFFFPAFFGEFEKIAATARPMKKAVGFDAFGRRLKETGGNDFESAVELNFDLVAWQKAGEPDPVMFNGNKGLTVAGQTFNNCNHAAKFVFVHSCLLLDDFRALQALITRHVAEQRACIVEKVSGNTVARIIDKSAGHWFGFASYAGKRGQEIVY